MPTRKQRRRAVKERRHEYETVWVDSEGNELEEPPADAAQAPRAKRDPDKAKSQARPQQRGGGRQTRVPPEPSWRRSIRRSLIWVGVLIALLLWLQSRQKHPTYGVAIVMGAIYLLLFPVFTYYLDRTVYRRYLKQQANKKS